jgi:hypothetical protein
MSEDMILKDYFPPIERLEPGQSRLKRLENIIRSGIKLIFLI